MDELKIYWAAFKASLLTKLEYRGDVIISTLGGVCFQLGPLLAYGVLSHYAPELGGWKRGEMLFLFGMWAMALGISELFFNNIWDFPFNVIEGSIDRLLVYPVRSLPFYIVCGPTLHSFANVVAGAWMVSASDAPAQLGASAWFLVPLWVACGCAVYTSLLVILASMVVLLPGRGLDMLWMLAQFNWAARYPLSAYPFALRVILLTVMPLAIYHYLPGEWMFHGGSAMAGLGAPVIAAIFWGFLANSCWESALNRYESTGS